MNTLKPLLAFFPSRNPLHLIGADAVYISRLKAAPTNLVPQGGSGF